MLWIKDNFSLQNNYLITVKLIINNQYKLENVLLRKHSINEKSTYTPLKTRTTHTNKNAISARLLCILYIKRISKGAKEYSQLKECLHVY